MVQYTNLTYICMVFTTQFAEACRVSMWFIYNIVRVVAANAKAAAARAKLAITEQISHFREKWEMADQSVTTPFGNQTTESVRLGLPEFFMTIFWTNLMQPG